ncbi:MAG: hypothetical protein KTR31_02645 [Myxococcales bacterium]|nr:hypothetical protein [Myxococcales bacterium]
MRAVLAEGLDRCVWSFFVNSTDVWWQTGTSEELAVQLRGLQAQLKPASSRREAGPTALVRFHEGRPTVSGVGYEFPERDADWRMAIDGQTHRRVESSLRSSGEKGVGFEALPGGRRLVAIRVDVWLWRLRREELRIPEGFVVLEAGESGYP